MVIIPFGSGLVAAFIFLVFEVVVVPLTFYSTSKLAALVLYWRARKGNHVVVDEMKFPLWSEGLTVSQWGHVALLMVRIVLLAIPVYLETTLDSSDVPEMISRNVQTAFIPEASDDWLSYQTAAGKDIRTLRDEASKVFFACTSMDEDGWVWARVANVTGTDEDQQHIQCLNGTAKAVFRLPAEIVDFDEDEEILPHYVNFGVSWTQGRLDEFPQDLVVDWRENTTALANETAFRVREVKALNDSGLDCYFADSVMTRDSMFISGRAITHWRGWCERAQDEKWIALYVIKIGMEMLPMLNSTPAQKGKMERRNATTVVEVSYRGSLGFDDTVTMGAKQLANYRPDWFTTGRTSDIARVVAYTMVRNASVVMPSGRMLARTEVELRDLVIGGAEVALVVALTVALAGAWRWRWRAVQLPNTVGGLAQCWARAAGARRVRLALRRDELGARHFLPEYSRAA